MKVIDTKYEIGDIVYLKTDPEQVERQVFAYIVYRSEIIYKVTMGTTVSEHYDFELTSEKTYVSK